MRWVEHVNMARNKGSTSPFHRAIMEFGPESFRREVLEFTDIENVDERETHYILLMGTLRPNGYNVNVRCKGGSRRAQIPDVQPVSMSARVQNRSEGSVRGYIRQCNTNREKLTVLQENPGLKTVRLGTSTANGKIVIKVSVKPADGVFDDDKACYFGGKFTEKSTAIDDAHSFIRQIPNVFQIYETPAYRQHFQIQGTP